MSLYAAADEARIRAAARVRAWTRSGFLTTAQGIAIESDLRVDVRRTNRYLRFALFVFGTIVVWAAVGLSLLLFDANQDWAIGWTAILAGAIACALAGFLVVRFRLYRFGIEEALAVWSAVLVALGAGFLTSAAMHGYERPALVAFGTAAIASLGVYWLFGYLYAACGAVAALAATAFWLGLPRFAEHLLSATMLIAVFLAARRLRRPRGEDFPGDYYGVIEAVAWAGSYVVLNLRLTLNVTPAFLGIRAATDVPAAFYWATYAATWLLPATGLALGLREKHRPMIWSGLATAIATLLTSKAYLGRTPNTWDPILLGVLLAGTAILVRRWLAAGAGGHRHGFTSQSLVASDDKDRIGVLSTVAAVQQPMAARTRPETPAFEAGRGGRSGGAGGGTDF
jgi:hypothetical protein